MFRNSTACSESRKRFVVSFGKMGMVAALVTLVTVTLSVFPSTSADAADKYPKPDFTGIKEYYTLVNYKYDFPRPWLILTVKLKKDIDQYDSFSVHFLDEDGAEVGEYIHGQPTLGGHKRAGEVVHEKVGTPTERDMAKVKKIVFRREAS